MAGFGRAPYRRFDRSAVASGTVDQRLAHVTAPDYLSGLTDRPLDEVRAMRGECQVLENALSYVRRLAQGRLDIVGAELERRRAGGDPHDLTDLIGRLPDILADRVAAGGLARPPQELTLEELTAEYTAEVDAILSPARVGSLDDLGDDELAAIRDRLEAYERDASRRRHDLHAIIDQLQAEIARRYRSGEASVDTLLR
jgi:hypothetical protein